MWQISKKIKRTETFSNQGLSDKTARKIAERLLWIQRCWAKWMYKQSERFSQKTKKILFACFVLTALIWNGLIVFKSLMPGNDKQITSHATLKLPPLIIHKNDYSRLDSTVKKNVQMFRIYWDSLENTVSGRKKRDSILKQRPGLMDSLMVIEKFYQLQ